ncbi:hypothetical protein L3X38_002732 [Prunus dulcis]|uniref:Ankyrin repeat family protein n=1 Tax=Prunus dulcis TaxID=3755 RepID=A0AAD4WV20_PRUDU|nr:hypothetical protein L3X38_002723 [Prunus dulcis]KAI5349841.1 hypothetical protein L3X38_002732 [Prunus dulcis]
MVTKDRSLVSLRNIDGETPLFLAALNGHNKAFLCLHSHCQEKYHSFRDNNGDTILHAAISGEYFSLAFQIIRLYPELVNSMNENGFSPLHILASKPSAFKSSSRLGLIGHIIYQCLIVEELKEESYKYEACLHNEGARNNSKYPENYETCMNFAGVLRSFFQVLSPLPNAIHLDAFALGHVSCSQPAPTVHIGNMNIMHASQGLYKETPIPKRGGHKNQQYAIA